MLAVSVPKIRAKKHLAAEVRPRKVENWLAALPQASARDSAEQLLQALFGQNRTALDTENRISIMELYREPVIAAVDVIRKSFTSAAYPLSGRNLEHYLLVGKLLGEVANGYKIVANDLIAKSKPNKSDLVLALQRSMHFLGQDLLHAYQSYYPTPTGVWRELHQLYLYAETHHLLNFPVAAPDSGSPDGLCTISDSYQQIALVGACHPYGLMNGECAQLYQLFVHWQSSAQVSADLGKRDPTGKFVISLASDAAPVPLEKAQHIATNDQFRLLNALDVVREVHSILRNLKRDLALGSLRSAGGKVGLDPSDIDLIRRAGRMLSGVKTKRRSSRKEKQEVVTICCGVGAIHYFMSGEKRFDTVPPTEIEEVEASAAVPPVAERYIDLAAPISPAAQAESATAPVPSDPWQAPVVYQSHTCRTKNESASGLCLQVVKPSSLQVHVGDVASVQENTNGKWRVGVVRWMRCLTDDLLEFGMELLAPEVKPVLVKRVSQNETVPGLLLAGNAVLKSPTSLIVSRGTELLGEKLSIIESVGTIQSVTPLRVLDRSGSFSQLLLAPPPRS